MAEWMDTVLVAVSIAAAVGFLVFRKFARKKNGCDTGCGCTKPGEK